MPETYVSLAQGDAAPPFVQRSSGPRPHSSDDIAGRYSVLFFFGSSRDPAGRAAVDAALQHRSELEQPVSFIGVSLDPADAEPGRLPDAWPRVRFVFDHDGPVSRLYGANPSVWGSGPVAVRRRWFLLDPGLRVVAVFPFEEDGAERTALFAELERLPALDQRAGVQVQAPVLVLPNVFDAHTCAELIALYERSGGIDSTVQRDKAGMSVNQVDPTAKRRKDHTIADKGVRVRLHADLQRRVLPEIAKVHHFRATYIERYLIGCYAAEDQAHFGAHRDNSTKGTAHRKFAVSVNLNDDFEGGELMFPEYGERGFKPSAGGAVVFSCSLLHAVRPVTRGRRYAFLPFLYDEDGARLREQNKQFVAGGETRPSGG